MCKNILTLTLVCGQPECFYPEAEEALCDVSFAGRPLWGGAVGLRIAQRPYYTACRPFIVNQTHLDITHDCPLMRLNSSGGEEEAAWHIKKLKAKEQQKDCFGLSTFRTSSQAPSYASPKLWLTHLLTGVKCRATSVAKNMCNIYFHLSKESFKTALLHICIPVIKKKRKDRETKTFDRKEDYLFGHIQWKSSIPVMEYDSFSV